MKGYLTFGLKENGTTMLGADRPGLVLGATRDRLGMNLYAADTSPRVGAGDPLQSAPHRCSCLTTSQPSACVLQARKRRGMIFGVLVP